MAMEIRQAMRNRPGTANLPGMMLRSRFAVLDAPPASDAIPLKAPAIRKMNSMITMLSSPIPWAQIWIFSSKDSFLFCKKAAIRAIENASTTDTT